MPRGIPKAQAGENAEKLRQQKLQVQLELEKLKLAERKGELILKTTMLEILHREFTSIRQKLIALPSSVANELYTLDSAAQIKARLDAKIVEILEDISE